MKSSKFGKAAKNLCYVGIIVLLFSTVVVASRDDPAVVSTNNEPSIDAMYDFRTLESHVRRFILNLARGGSYNNNNSYNNNPFGNGGGGSGGNNNNPQIVYLTHPPPPPPDGQQVYYYQQPNGNYMQNIDNRQTYSYYGGQLRDAVLNTVMRVLKIVGTAFLISEILARWGTFGDSSDEVPFDFNKQVIEWQDAWDRFQIKYLNMASWRNFLKKTRRELPSRMVTAAKAYRSLPNKTKFATGTSLGMVWSRLMLRISWKVTKWFGLWYIGHELLQHFNVIGSEDSMLNRFWKANVHDKLIQEEQQKLIVQIADYCRNVVMGVAEVISDRFQYTVAALIEEETATAVGMAAGTMIGFLL
mmetsp:Transcript_2159/g.2931  ORF Transcript_2159/g.2931 Transcript_2159/m.2931 type:complete len:358 (-) Transcript_2159:47-1120(-)